MMSKAALKLAAEIFAFTIFYSSFYLLCIQSRSIEMQCCWLLGLVEGKALISKSFTIDIHLGLWGALMSLEELAAVVENSNSSLPQINVKNV